MTIPLWACLLGAIWITAWLNMTSDHEYDMGPAFVFLAALVGSLLVWIGWLLGWL
jgi:hypothetical protein